MGTRRVSPSALSFSAPRSRDLPLSVHRVPLRGSAFVAEEGDQTLSARALAGNG
jgi:hypothetical protein